MKAFTRCLSALLVLAALNGCRPEGNNQKSTADNREDGTDQQQPTTDPTPFPGVVRVSAKLTGHKIEQTSDNGSDQDVTMSMDINVHTYSPDIKETLHLGGAEGHEILEPFTGECPSIGLSFEYLSPGAQTLRLTGLDLGGDVGCYRVMHEIAATGLQLRFVGVPVVAGAGQTAEVVDITISDR